MSKEMSKYEGTHTGFYVLRVKQDEPQEQIMKINGWDGSTYWVDNIESSTEFESLEKAKEAAQIQSMFMKFAGITCELKILQKDEVIQFVNDKE